MAHILVSNVAVRVRDSGNAIAKSGNIGRRAGVYRDAAINRGRVQGIIAAHGDGGKIIQQSDCLQIVMQHASRYFPNRTLGKRIKKSAVPIFAYAIILPFSSAGWPEPGYKINPIRIIFARIADI